MKAITLYILFFLAPLVSIANGVSAGDQSSIQLESFRLQSQIREQSRLNRIRSIESYKRIYSICSSPVELSKLNYSFQSAKQVMSIGFTFDKIEVERLMGSDNLLSQQLKSDLDSEAFTVAIKDCGYNLEDTRRLILSLILTDVSGKLVGAVGVLTGYRLIGRGFMKLKVSMPKFYKAFFGVSIASGVYYAYKQFFGSHSTESSFAQEGDENAVIVSSAADLDLQFKTEESRKQMIDFALITIESLEDEIHASEQLINSGELTEQELMDRKQLLFDLNVELFAVQSSIK